MAAVAAGDRPAYAVLVARYLREVVSLAQSIVGNPADADDIAQEAFLRVWNHAGRWDRRKAGIRTWLHRIVMHLAIDKMRAARPADSVEGIELEADSITAFESLCVRDRARALDRALSLLPPRQRAALALFYFSGLPAGQAAQALSLKVNAFEALLVRARRALLRKLQCLGYMREHL